MTCPKINGKRRKKYICLVYIISLPHPTRKNIIAIVCHCYDKEWRMERKNMNIMESRKDKKGGKKGFKYQLKQGEHI